MVAITAKSKVREASSKNNKRKIDSKQHDSDLSASNKKRALKHARQAHRPHSEVVVASKEMWNKLRLKCNTEEQVKEIMKDMMEILKGKFHQIAMQHDASRVVQAALQHGNDVQKKSIVKEICSLGNLVELSKVQYAHFVVLKMIKSCYKDAECMRIIVKALKGHASKLAVHAIGARVIELLFSTFPQKITSPLKLEFYGPRFSLFNHSGVQSDSTFTSATLTTIIKRDPNTKEAALQSILTIINKGVEKSLFSFAYFQKILCEYVVCASPNEVQSLGPSLVDHAIHLLSTKHGSRVVAECAAYGTSKDRKKIMKSLKGYTRSSMLHNDAYMAILRILDVIDDTVSAQKSILAELKLPIAETKMKDISSDEVEKEDKKSTLLDLALSDTGSKLFLFLLANNQDIRKKYFDPSELEILRPNPTIQDGSSEIPTSKKDPKTRRVELLQFLRNDLLELCQSHTSKLLRSRCGSKVILEVFKTFPVVNLVSSIIDAIQDSLKDDALSLFEDPIGHRSIKKMLMPQSNCKSATEEESIVLLSTALSSTFKGKLLESIGRSNRGAFVLSALAKSDQIGNVGKELKNVQKDIKRISEKMKDDGKPIAGYQLLMSVQD